jgi:hypothetical protein
MEYLNVQKSDVSSQIFIIRQDRSWTSLNVSLELFESFLQIYNVFPQIWKYAFTFGRKYEENEFQFPGFAAGHIPYQRDGVNPSESYGKLLPCFTKHSTNRVSKTRYSLIGRISVYT